MEKRIVGIFMFLLFAVSTIALDPIVLTASDVVSKEPTIVTDTVSDAVSKEPTIAGDTDPVIPAEKLRSNIVETTANEELPESIQTQTFVVTTDPAPRLIFSRSLPIQRHSFDRSTRIPLRFVRRHPCRKFKKTFPAMMSYGNDMILSDKTTSVDPESLGDPIPTKWLEFKHKYGHRHHHRHHDKDEKFEMKFEYNGEKKKEHKGGFMRRIRKFLKHTFD